MAPANVLAETYFYPRPPRGGRRRPLRLHPPHTHISIHALREEGDPKKGKKMGKYKKISIHALREEGDLPVLLQDHTTGKFLSTPSARRATYHPGLFSRGVNISIHALREEGDYLSTRSTWYLGLFLSTPSARRATIIGILAATFAGIFLSTPSARRATRSRSPSPRRWAFLSTPSARRATQPAG